MDGVWSMSLTNLIHAILLAVGTTVFYLCLRCRPGRREQSLSHGTTAHEASHVGKGRGVRLLPVAGPSENEVEPDVDIIAIHGLDTRSPDTWVWKDKRRKLPDVNWLSDPTMLPSKVGPARIFTCDWPADLFEPSGLSQKTQEEFARRLLDGIKRRPSATNKRAGEDQPILFIASCLGGIILMKALDMANNEYSCIRTATRAIVFLATPFRGTSFQDVANWAEPGLRTWALIRGQRVTKLLDSVKESFYLGELVTRFTQLRQEQAHPYQVMTFYEKGKTNLYHKIFPHIPVGAKPLVDEFSATLPIVPHPLSLDRPHRLMNKFAGPEDHDYEVVAGKIEEFLQNIRKKEADDWIRDKCYTAKRLEIERLSHGRLPMDRCYINLAIVEQPGQVTHATKEGDALASPFSLLARQKVQTPDKLMQVELATVFNERTGRDGQVIRPRRILIRGRAGVGKTTLCKKIIYEFYRGTWVEWTKMFDRILWVPLRNLKLPERRHVPVYNLEDLFSHEYFSLASNRAGLARELSTALATKRNKTLFLLDGLDEVSQDLVGEDSISRFLKVLLEQPNVIITSRPSAKAPPDLHLELETVGFYPNQVSTYLQMVFDDPKEVKEVQSFLDAHWLIQSLVRIPIQLDALCYTWGSFSGTSIPQTMTAIYQKIAESLWKKDAVHLEKEIEGKLLMPPHLENAEMESDEMNDIIGKELRFLEGIAFTGMYNDAIDFDSKSLNAISKQFKLPGETIFLDKTLPHLSFLRASILRHGIFYAGGWKEEH
ncbi:hypothetical protein ATERTT37_002700 [Aspergillus terreus]